MVKRISTSHARHPLAGHRDASACPLELLDFAHSLARLLVEDAERRDVLAAAGTNNPEETEMKRIRALPRSVIAANSTDPVHWRVPETEPAEPSTSSDVMTVPNPYKVGSKKRAAFDVFCATHDRESALAGMVKIGVTRSTAVSWFYRFKQQEPQHEVE